MQLHFLSFLLDITSWIIAGAIISKLVFGLKRRVKKQKARFYFTVIMASLIGGLLAELAMGSSGLGISLTNLCVAIFASLVGIFLAFPTYATLLKARGIHATVESLKTIRINLLSFKK